LALALSACDDGYVSPRRALFADAGIATDQLDAAAGVEAAAQADAGRADERRRPAAASDEDAGTSRPDGVACERDDECASAHCNNGLCCRSGECCSDVRDCSVGTGIAIICDDASTCQGSRGPVACRRFRCTTQDGESDDSACDQRVVADECGPFASISCTGEAEQMPPRCANTCESDNDCDRDAHCDSTCLPDVRRGGACDENSDCTSGQCNGGRCCVEGNCARDLTELPAAGLRQCLDTLASDVCSECGCTRCTVSMLGCYDSGNEGRDSLCSTVLECAFREACFDACTDGEDCFRQECWCGNDCPGTTGSCTRPIEAAAGGANSTMTLASRAVDPGYALYYAEQYGACLNQNCRSECDLDR
jgi:hypothetical protein